MSDANKKIQEAIHKYVSVFQEFYIEFFATFIPGFIFLTLIIFISSIALLCWRDTSLDDLQKIIVFLANNCSHWCLFFAIVIISYTFGAVLYRKDPNVPDKISAYRQWRNASAEERKRLAVQFDDYDCSLEGRCKNCFLDFFAFYISPGFVASRKKVEGYPYSYLRQYLLKRGMGHLIGFVPWCKHVDGGAENQRSKVTVNALKTIIKMYGNGNFNLDLLRNEGHIRMLTSLWHVMKISRIFLLACLALVSLIYLKVLPWNEVNPKLLLGAVVLLIIMFRSKHSIEIALHYVRSREIVTVLEQAYIVRDQMKGWIESDIWKDLERRNEAFCKKVKDCVEGKSCAAMSGCEQKKVCGCEGCKGCCSPDERAVCTAINEEILKGQTKEMCRTDDAAGRATF